ncbi:hypothetical protein Bca4012_063309 [Brassica carinata]
MVSRLVSIEEASRDPNIRAVPLNKEASKEGENTMKPKYTTTYVSEPETGEDCETRRETHESLEEEDDRREEPVKRIVLLGAEIIIGRGEKQPQSEDDAKVKALNGDEDEPPFASPNIITPTKPIRKSARVSAVSKNLNMTATRNLVVYGPVDEAKFKALNAFIKENGDSRFPVSGDFKARDFFSKFLRPKGWLNCAHLDVPLAMYRLSAIGAIPKMVIKEAARPFALMVPYVLYSFSDAEVKQFMDTDMFSIRIEHLCDSNMEMMRWKLAAEMTLMSCQYKQALPGHASPTFSDSSWTRENKIRLCYLAILTGGLHGLDRRQAIPPAKANMIMDLETFEQYPWGRVAFVELVHQVKEATECCIMKNSYVCKGFVQVLQITVTSMYPRSRDEVRPLWEQQDVDPEIDRVFEYILQDKPLRNIAWQALSKYPLTPIQCNKRRLVSGQKKSKKSNTVAREGQENIAVRKTPEERFDMKRLKCLYETTLQNLEDIVDALERTGRRADKVLEMVSRLVSIEEASRDPNIRAVPLNKEASKEGENTMKPKYTTTYVSEPETGEDCETRRETHESLEEEDDRREEPVKRIVLLGAEILVGRGENQPQSADDAKVKALNGDEDEPPFASSNIITPTKPIRKSARVSAVSKNLNMTATRNLVVYGPVDEAKVKALNAFVKENLTCGDCGIYAVKYVECLVMGVAFSEEHLCDSNMDMMKWKLAAEMTLMSCQYKQALPGHASPTFSDRSRRSTPSDEDIIALCQSSDVCISWTRKNKIRLCYLAILTGGLLVLDQRQAIPPAKANLIMDLETFEQYPWGRVVFVELVHQVKEATECRIMENSYVCKGFVKVLQITVTSMCPRSRHEVCPLWEQKDVDPKIDRLFEYILQDKPLRNIAWQALPKYPLTPIQCNKRRLVAGQKKSKKSKTVAREGQENIAVRCEKCEYIAKAEEQKESHEEQLIIKRRKTPEEQFEQLIKKVEFWEKKYESSVLSVFEYVGDITMDGLASRIVQLEDIMLFKTPQNDRSSCTKLPSKLAKSSVCHFFIKLMARQGSKDTTGKTTIQGNDEDQDPGKGGHKEEELPFEVEYIDVVKNPPQPVGEEHPDNPEEESAEEEADEERPKVETEPSKEQHLCLLVPKIEADEERPKVETESSKEQHLCLLVPKIESDEERPKVETEPSKKQHLCLLVPKIEETSESKKEPDDETAITVSSESHPFARMEKTEKENDEATSSASVTTVQPCKDFEDLVIERRRMCLQYLALHPPPKIDRTRSTTRASTFFNVLLQPRKWLTGEASDLTFDTFVAMIISIPDQTVKIYDSGEPEYGDIRLRKEAEPFARMFYALWFFANVIDKPSVDRTEFSIECIWKGVPRARYPYGDCGVYALKFLECLMMGVEFSAKHLNDDKMVVVREKLAAELYVAKTREGVNMSNEEFATNAIDENLSMLANSPCEEMTNDDEIKIGKYGLKGNRVAIALPIIRLVALESHYCLAKVFWELFASPASEIRIGKYGLKGNRVAIALPITRLVALKSHYALPKLFAGKKNLGKLRKVPLALYFGSVCLCLAITRPPASEIKIGKYGLKGNRVAIALPIIRLLALESHYCLAKVPKPMLCLHSILDNFVFYLSKYIMA